jgi:hypothetical protein
MLALEVEEDTIIVGIRRMRDSPRVDESLVSLTQRD